MVVNINSSTIFPPTLIALQLSRFVISTAAPYFLHVNSHSSAAEMVAR